MLILCLMLPSLSVQLVTINSISQYHVWEMTFWNVVRIVLEGYLHSIFVSTFRDINYITWTQNNVIILPRYFPIINLNQLSLNPTKEDISLLISPMSYKGRILDTMNSQSVAGTALQINVEGFTGSQWDCYRLPLDMGAFLPIKEMTGCPFRPVPLIAGSPGQVGEGPFRPLKRLHRLLFLAFYYKCQ